MTKINLQKHSRTLRLRYVLTSFCVGVILCINFSGFSNKEESSVMTATNATWTNGSNMPNALYFGGSASYQRNGNNWLFLIGGSRSSITSDVYKYDLNLNTWTAVAPYPTNITVNAAAIVGDSIYSFGGFHEGITTTASAYRYDISENSWTPIAPLRMQNAFMKAVGYQDSLIYIAGGFGNGPDGGRDTVLLYNVKTNSYRNTSPMPVDTRGGACTIVGDTIVYMCGSQSTRVLRGLISQTDRNVINWSFGTSFPGRTRARFDARPWGIKGLIMTGGSDSTAVFQAVTNECYTYSPGLDQWTFQPFKPTRWNSGYSGSFNENGVWRLVCAGGYSGTTALDRTEIFTDPMGPTSIENNEVSLNTYQLSQNYPNPFNPETIISFSIPHASHVVLKVYDAAGKEVSTLINKYSPSGTYEVKFNSSSINGSSLSSGIYFYKLEAGNFTSIKKMILVK